MFECYPNKEKRNICTTTWLTAKNLIGTRREPIIVKVFLKSYTYLNIMWLCELIKKYDIILISILTSTKLYCIKNLSYTAISIQVSIF